MGANPTKVLFDRKKIVFIIFWILYFKTIHMMILFHLQILKCIDGGIFEELLTEKYKILYYSQAQKQQT